MPPRRTERGRARRSPGGALGSPARPEVPRRCGSAACGCPRRRRPESSCAPSGGARQPFRLARRPRTPTRRGSARFLRGAGWSRRRALLAWALRRDLGTSPRLALDLEPACKRLDAVDEPAKPGPPGRVGPADAVVGDLDDRGAVLPADADARRRGVCVLGDVGQWFGDYVVGWCFVFVV